MLAPCGDKKKTPTCTASLSTPCTRSATHRRPERPDDLRICPPRTSPYGVRILRYRPPEPGSTSLRSTSQTALADSPRRQPSQPLSCPPPGALDPRCPLSLRGASRPHRIRVPTLAVSVTGVCPCRSSVRPCSPSVCPCGPAHSHADTRPSTHSYECAAMPPSPADMPCLRGYATYRRGYRMFDCTWPDLWR